MKLNVLVLGAGFGGLELSSLLSEALGENLDLTLIDKNDSFFFGFSKLDVMFGKKTSDSVRLYYKDIVKPGVRFQQEEILEIDPETRKVVTNKGNYQPDILVIALEQITIKQPLQVYWKGVMSFIHLKGLKDYDQ